MCNFGGCGTEGTEDSVAPGDGVSSEGGTLPPPFSPPQRVSLPEAAVAVAACAGKGAGQLIDLETGKNETVDSSMSQAAVLEMFPDLRGPALLGDTEEPPQGATTAAGRRDSDQPQTPADLVLAVVQLHQTRVAVHRAYDGAFRHLLKGKGGGPKALARTYPFVVAAVTARFQALSEAARDAASALEVAAAARGESGAEVKEAAALVRKVQGLEQARLQLVAMHHIEQSQLHTSGGGDSARCASSYQQLGSAAEEIEETVSELRYCAAELRERDA